MPIGLSTRSELYDVDLAAWLAEQAALARSGLGAELDLPHLAEALDDLGKTLRRALRSQLRRVILHLLKWRFQPDRRSRSWVESIDNGRAEIGDILADSPSLRGQGPGLLVEIWPSARGQAIRQTGLSDATFPQDCPFTLDEVLDPDVLPD